MLTGRWAGQLYPNLGLGMMHWFPPLARLSIQTMICYLRRNWLSFEPYSFWWWSWHWWWWWWWWWKWWRWWSLILIDSSMMVRSHILCCSSLWYFPITSLETKVSSGNKCFLFPISRETSTKCLPHKSYVIKKYDHKYVSTKCSPTNHMWSQILALLKLLCLLKIFSLYKKNSLNIGNKSCSEKMQHNLVLVKTKYTSVIVALFRLERS